MNNSGPSNNLARALTPCQPYSIAVLSTGGRFYILSFLRKRGMVKKEASSLIVKIMGCFRILLFKNIS